MFKKDEPKILTFVPPDSDPALGTREKTLTKGEYKNITTELGKSSPLLDTDTMTSVPPGFEGDGQSTTALDCQVPNTTVVPKRHFSDNELMKFDPNTRTIVWPNSLPEVG